MGLKQSIQEEYSRSPIATIAAVIGAAVGVITLMLSQIQFNSSHIASNSVPEVLSVTSSQNMVSNLFLAVAFFISIAFSGATLVRIVAAKHDIAALFLSVPLAALTNFFTILIIYLSPPRNIDTTLFASAHELTRYSIAVVYLIICAKAVLIDLTKTSTKKDSDDKSDENSSALAAIVIALILLSVWSSAVSKGESLLVSTFLPEVTHVQESVVH